MSEKACETCHDKRTVTYNPSPVHSHIVAEMPCPTCRRVVSREFVEAADALLVKIADEVWKVAATGIPRYAKEWTDAVNRLRAARGDKP